MPHLQTNIMQTTIMQPMSCYGIGVHSGQRTQLTLKPAPSNTGIICIRTDVSSVNNVIAATYNNVSETTLSTTIQNDTNIKISTIEHLMAALWGCGIDNVIIELDGPEVPIMDGSSKPFVFLIECAGTKILNAPRKIFKIMKDIHISHNGAEIIVTPHDSFAVNVEIEFASKAIGKQTMGLDDVSFFKEEISSARTFGFMHELEYLRTKGLAKGASLENAVGIENDIIMNPEGLRFSNEFARHKLLDSVGDFYTAGGIIQGNFTCTKSGHNLNNMLLRHIFDNPNNYQIL
jgi:UDP-3-O-[3-hydroxymyristoyl] N-acetylglucosamine deacetylase